MHKKELNLKARDVNNGNQHVNFNGGQRAEGGVSDVLRSGVRNANNLPNMSPVMPQPSQQSSSNCSTVFDINMLQRLSSQFFYNQPASQSTTPVSSRMPSDSKMLKYRSELTHPHHPKHYSRNRSPVRKTKERDFYRYSSSSDKQRRNWKEEKDRRSSGGRSSK